MDASSDTQHSGTSSEQNGFSLIEAMVALLLLLFMLAAVATLMNSTIQTNRQTRRLTAAVFLAQDQMERLRGTNFAALASGSDGPLSEEGDSTASGPYTRTWTVTDNAGPPPDGTPPTGTRNIAVMVQWTEKGDPNPRSVTLQTVVAQQ